MESSPPPEDVGVIFSAVTSSARQMFQLLNCIGFSNKVDIHVTDQGLNFRVEDTRVMQGSVFLDKALFTTYQYTASDEGSGDESDSETGPKFQISLPALLETLQIFGAAEAASRFHQNAEHTTNIRKNRPDAFSNPVLGTVGICRLTYVGNGHPFSIILEEAGVTTTCNLTTYEPETPTEIPLARDAMQVKIIMQPRWLLDAVNEVAQFAPEKLSITAHVNAPYLTLSASGHLGDVSIDFSKGRDLLENFAVKHKWTQSYRFKLIQQASDAMKLATKVSLRGDEQGVLSLQFMVEIEGCGVNFVDFRFVPNTDDDEDGESVDGDYNEADEDAMEQ